MNTPIATSSFRGLTIHVFQDTPTDYGYIVLDAAGNPLTRYTVENPTIKAAQGEARRDIHLDGLAN